MTTFKNTVLRMIIGLKREEVTNKRLKKTAKCKARKTK